MLIRGSVQILGFCCFAMSTVACANGTANHDTRDTESGAGGAGGDSSSGAAGDAGGGGQGGSTSIITVMAGGNGGESSDPDAALTADAACAAESRDSQVIVVDLFIMIDRSVSMGCSAAETGCTDPRDFMTIVPPTRWTAVGDAMTAFVNAPATAGIGAGVGFFALDGTGQLCDVAAYSMPTAPIATLPGSATTILNAIKNAHPGNTTPTVPALQGAINYATSYATSTPGHSAAVAFVTDGLPAGCPNSNNTIPNAATIAQTAFTGTPSIKTYVLGMGFVSNLDAIALAGSGGAQHYFPLEGDVTTGLTTALKQISQQTIKCDYSIPTMGQALDYGRVNVQTKVGAAGAPGLVGNVSDASKCTAAGGWFYDVNPTAGSKPSKITLCPQSCDPLSMTDGSSLKVLIGCATVPAMIK